jgi:hypothetical protein
MTMNLRTFMGLVLLLQTLFARSDLILTSLDEPIVLWTWGPPVTETIDLDGDGSPELTLAVEVGFAGVRGEDGTRYVVYEDPPPNIGGAIEPLLAGDEIGPEIGPDPVEWFGSDAAFAPFIICVTSGCDTRFQLDGIPKYMGVEFDRSDGTHYAWVRVFSGGTVASVSVTEWAWESMPGVSIIAGVVPEPTSALLMLLGASPFVVLRKKLLTTGCCGRNTAAEPWR